ncbi:SDR family NAD(P)-dependent oxidoreductase [Paenibacillus hamazuiensis]|uniref:SDR family NAD(P)-dependent oxidoreductase n=1 Tax=Paenibacillus hamazuiensis TaxID=2936508 RepID=UPI003B8483F9
MKPIHQQVILITGATDGIGKQTAIDLAVRGATVLLHGRSDERGKASMVDISSSIGNAKVKFYKADFS